MILICFQYHVQDTLKNLIENYCKTHCGHKTTSEASMIERTQSSADNNHQENTLFPTLAQRHSSDCCEANQGTDPAWTERFNLHQLTELTGHMNGKTGSWEVAMLTESVSRVRVSKPAIPKEAFWNPPFTRIQMIFKQMQTHFYARVIYTTYCMKD